MKSSPRIFNYWVDHMLNDGFSLFARKSDVEAKIQDSLSMSPLMGWNWNSSQIRQQGYDSWMQFYVQRNHYFEGSAGSLIHKLRNPESFYDHKMGNQQFRQEKTYKFIIIKQGKLTEIPSARTCATWSLMEAWRRRPISKNTNPEVKPFSLDADPEHKHTTNHKIISKYSYF